MVDHDIFKQALEKLEDSQHSDLRTLYEAMQEAPVPVVMYGADDSVEWANNAMLGVFFGLNDKQRQQAADHDIYGHPIKEIFPQYLHDYIAANNKVVRDTQKAQLEKDWSDEEWVDVVWDVVRYPVQRSKVVAMLIPKDDETTKRCQKAATT